MNDSGSGRLPYLRNRVAPAVAIAVVVSALYLAPTVFDSYALSQLNRVGALSLLAISVALLTNYCGLASLGQVAPFAIGAYTTYRLSEAGVLVGPVQLTVVAIECALFSLLIGPFILRARGIVFLMVTLAIGMLTAQAAEQWTTVTGGSDGTGLISASLPWWDAEPLVDDGDIYFYVLTVGVSVLLVASTLIRGFPGALLRGIRDNELRMHASGHRVTGYLLVAYIAAGVIAGVGGSLFATGQRFVSPSEVGFDVAAITLLAVMIGGAGSVVGSVVGVLLVMAVQYWLSPEGDSELWLGVLFVASVYLLPKGLSGRIEQFGKIPAVAELTRALKGESRSDAG